MPACEFEVAGLIGDRWLALGGEDGPLACPVGPEGDLPSARGRRQQFVGGEIAYAAGQEMVVSAFRAGHEACFDWALAPSSLLHYDYFRADVWHRAGVDDEFAGHGHARLKQLGSKRGRIWVTLQGPGEYAFLVEGCDEEGLFDPEKSMQGWTAPIVLTVALGGDLVEQRWQIFGGEHGPLGMPAEPPSELDGAVWRRYERGAVAAYPGAGPDMSMLAFQTGSSVEVHWGFVYGAEPGDTLFEVFNLDVAGPPEAVQLIQPSLLAPFEWAYGGSSSGRVVFDPRRDGIEWNTPGVRRLYLIRVTDATGRVFQLHLSFLHRAIDVRISAPALDGTPQHGYASHGSRVDSVVRHFIDRRPLTRRTQTGEDIAVQLAAHLHVVSQDRGYRSPGQLPSTVLVAICLREVRLGKVGTNKDYDLVLKGLAVLLFRYRALLNDAQVSFILDELIPQNLFGPHDPWTTIHTEEFAGFVFRGPETENHQLMIDSFRYLNNQIRFEMTGNPAYNSLDLGLTDWLLRFMHDIASHDFLEFNSRSYQRLSVSALLNLVEFASDYTVRTAARNLLDYAATKFAVSSSRSRHVGPFRRQKQNLNRPDDDAFNHLYSKTGHPHTGFFLTYLGKIDPAGRPEPWFPDGWVIEAVIAGLSSYRPPAAAYVLADSPRDPIQHTFFQGNRPQYPEGDHADPGLEIYYKSPSFLISAGGTFLNSGYGSDQHVELYNGNSGVAVAQATTLLPAWADATWAELIRFDRYPDGNLFKRRSAVCTGVHEGFACGANLRIPQRWLDMTGTPADGPWYVLDLGALGFYVALHRVPMGDTEHLVRTYGEQPGNFGVLHAMEASAIGYDFAEFRRRTLQLNPHPPLEYDYGGTYEFRTADDRIFTFVVDPVEDRWRSRIVAVNGTPLPTNFTMNRLAQGNFLRTPHGHDGYVEITHPGCDTPLVLDFRNPVHAVRRDNRSICLQWAVDVGRAFFERALQLFLDRSYAESLRAIRDVLAEPLGDDALVQHARDWLARAAAAHPHDVPAQLAAADITWEIVHFLAIKGGEPQRRRELAALLDQLTGFLAYGAPNPRKAVPAADLARILYLGLAGEDHRIDVAASWSSQALIHHVMWVHGIDVDRGAELAAQWHCATEAMRILKPMADVLPSGAPAPDDLRRMGRIFRDIVGTISFGLGDSTESVEAARYGRAVYLHLAGDHRIDVADLWVGLSLRHHEISFHPDCPDQPAEWAAQRAAAADGLNILVPVAQAMPDPAFTPYHIRQTADLLDRITGLLVTGAEPSPSLTLLVEQARTLRDRLRTLL